MIFATRSVQPLPRWTPDSPCTGHLVRGRVRKRVVPRLAAAGSIFSKAVEAGFRVPTRRSSAASLFRARRRTHQRVELDVRVVHLAGNLREERHVDERRVRSSAARVCGGARVVEDFRKCSKGRPTRSLCRAQSSRSPHESSALSHPFCRRKLEVVDRSGRRNTRRLLRVLS